MKNKVLKVSIIMLAIVLFGIITVNATEELLGEFSNYDIKSGNSSVMNGRAAHYDYGRADMFVDTADHGEKKLLFVV